MIIYFSLKFDRDFCILICYLYNIVSLFRLSNLVTFKLLRNIILRLNIKSLKLLSRELWVFSVAKLSYWQAKSDWQAKPY